MPKIGSVEKTQPQHFYDRIADVHNLAMKVNGYRASVSKYLKSLQLNIDQDSVVLDAGSGTGIVTLGFNDAGYRPQQIIALDLSIKSLKISRDQFIKRNRLVNKSVVVQGNILNMPFPDDSFDLVLMCGVLEYLPVEDGLRELARVLKKGYRLLLLPVRQSVVSSVLELLYDFKIHPPELVREVASQYFTIVDTHKFPITEPISWSRSIFLLEKK